MQLRGTCFSSTVTQLGSDLSFKLTDIVGFAIQTKLFGGELSCLISSDQSVPPLVDKLIQDIEKRGKVI